MKKVIQLKRVEGQQELELPRDPELEKYAPVWAQLQIQGERLVRIPLSHSDAASQVQVVLPKSMVPQVLAQLHSAPTGGLFGCAKAAG